MSPASDTPPRPPAPGTGGRVPGALLNRPLWQRFVIATVVAVVLLAAMVVWVSGHNTDSPPASQQHLSARANREAEIIVEQDQAPHTARLPSGGADAAGLARLLHARVAAQVARGAISGPLRAGECRPTGFGSRTGRGFTCSVESGSVFYPFLGVVNTVTGRVTYCKRDPPPVPSDYVPVSRRCRG
jgi:hypothetical protein